MTPDPLLTDPLLTDPLLTDLRDLAAPAPPALADGLLDRWVRVDVPAGAMPPVLVGFSTRGVSFVRPLTGDDPDGTVEGFLAAYRDRFGRPLRPAERAPAGVAATLAGDDGPEPALDLRGLSPFAVAVLAATRRIPRGQTRPYAWVAQEAGTAAAVRAAGTVLARNPVPLLVPCHRVTRSDGGLGRYLFGTERKAALLRAEGAHPTATSEEDR